MIEHQKIKIDQSYFQTGCVDVVIGTGCNQHRMHLNPVLKEFICGLLSKIFTAFIYTNYNANAQQPSAEKIPEIRST